MWAHQNGILHNLAHAHLYILENDINQQITVIYALGPQVLPWEAMHCVCSLIETILQLPLPAKQQWVELVELTKGEMAT